MGIIFRTTEAFTWCIIGNWVGERGLPASNPYGIDKGFKLDGYFVTNVVLTTRKYFENRVSASVNIRNIFNEVYLDPGMRTADGGLYSTVLEQPGRSAMFKIMVDLY
jgi:outer membrane receptor protein involved in Fe transport